MLEYIAKMFTSPESQDDSYSWAATFGGHAWIALGPWGLVALAWDTWTATLVTPLLYLVFWEGAQFYFATNRTRELAWDCILDAVAFAFACCSAAFLADRMLIETVACWGASVGVMGAGWRKRA
jgi:hypothetical protein